MKIIVNADDMGYMKCVSEGIIEGFKKGIVTSTTIMTHMPFAKKAAEMILPYTALGVGVHLTLTVGKPLTTGKTLVQMNGEFWRYKDFYKKIIDPKEVYDEFKAQIEEFVRLFKNKPTHIDSHQGCHDGVTVLLKNNPDYSRCHNTEEIYRVTMDIANEYNLPVRRACDYKWIDDYYGENATVEKFISVIESNKEKGYEKLEFMVHPAFCDLELFRGSSYNLFRVKELAGLCDPKLITYLDDNNIELVHF